MIDDYRGLAVFVAVADAGSFSEAGRRLGLSTSVVSHHISKLEDKLGLSLFFRSTRSLSLTPEGHTILTAAKRMVSAGEEAIDLLTQKTEQPAGILQIAMPAFGERSTIHQMVWDFARENPLVSVKIKANDKQVDLIKGGFDLAIRLGKLRDNSAMSKKLGQFHRTLVAASRYLSKSGPLHTIEDLKNQDFISVAMLSQETTLIKGSEKQVFNPERSRIEVDSIMAAKSAVMAGLGIRTLPTSEIEAELESGELVQVLPDWHVPAIPIYAVWPERGRQKGLTRSFIEFLLSNIR